MFQISGTATVKGPIVYILTSFYADLIQDINEDFAFSKGVLLEYFLIFGKLTQKKNLSGKCSIKAPAKF